MKLVDSLISLVHEVLCAIPEGMAKVWHKIAHHYNWPNFRKDIQHYVTGSRVCDKFSNSPKLNRLPLSPFSTVNGGELVATDIIGGKEPLIKTLLRNKYILLIVDAFTKYLVTVPFRDQQARTVTNLLLSSLILEFCPPHRLF